MDEKLVNEANQEAALSAQGEKAAEKKRAPLSKRVVKRIKRPLRKAVKKGRGILKDLQLDLILPSAYKRACRKPVDENKVILIEQRYDTLTNTFQLLYKELLNYSYEIHIHYLRNTYVSTWQYLKNCRALMKDMATAKYVFMAEASDVVSCVETRPETVITQLWHACGAFKRFGKSTADLIFGPNAEQLARHPFNRNYTNVTVSSPEICWAYIEAMDLSDHPEIVKPVGVSRTDVFFKQEVLDAAREHVYDFFPAARGKKIILFAPTFRGRVAKAKTVTNFDYKLFAEKFSGDYVVIAKHHPHVRRLPKIPEELDGTFAKDATRDLSIEDLLCMADVVISDYSSLIFEYSLFERPMLFYAYDLETYFDWRGFYYDYDELTPGPVCRTNEEMVDYIEHLSERFDRDEVRRFREKFMSSCDGHATERIMKMVFGEESLKAHRKEG